MIRIAYMSAALCLLAGCAGGPLPDPAALSAVQRASDVPLIPEVTGWLDVSDESVQARSETCHMLKTALADSSHAWLWLEIDLPEGRYVRVQGHGALTFTLVDGDGTSEVRDAGLFVALGKDANAFLNSSSGPITIRQAHATSSSGRVKLLARLPAVDTSRTVVHDVRPVPKLWTLK